MRAGAYDQPTGPGVFGARPPYGALSDRPDVLSFATPPLAEDLEVAGPLELRLWVASDGPDADIHAKLIDLYPPNEDYPQGFAMNLTDGILQGLAIDAGRAPHLELHLPPALAPEITMVDSLRLSGLITRSSQRLPFFT